jgi:sodium/potassium-transporting ATPase subunit alpha
MKWMVPDVDPCGYFSYRTLSVRVEERQLPAKPKVSQDPADAIASIDVHLVTPEDVYTRYSTHPAHGLEMAAIQRKSKDARNVISPPQTQYLRKALNYVFGGFNFLMWIAFILTIVSVSVMHCTSKSHCYSSVVL